MIILGAEVFRNGASPIIFACYRETCAAFLMVINSHFYVVIFVLIIIMDILSIVYYFQIRQILFFGEKKVLLY